MNSNGCCPSNVFSNTRPGIADPKVNDRDVRHRNFGIRVTRELDRLVMERGKPTMVVSDTVSPAAIARSC
jgi:hypothetical protein